MASDAPPTPFPPALADAEARMRRAQEVHAQLRTEVAEVAASALRARALVPNDDGSEWRLSVAFDPKPDHQRWGLLLGDVLQNLRSSLDYLAWRLVTRGGDKPHNARVVAFPIVHDSAKFDDAVKRMLPGVDAEVVGTVERHQPFTRQPQNPQEDALWVLHRLAAKDRHRLIRETKVSLMPDSRTRIDGPPGSTVVLHSDVVDGGPAVTYSPPTPTLETPRDLTVNVEYGLALPVPLASPATFALGDRILRPGPDNTSGVPVDHLLNAFTVTVEGVLRDFFDFFDFFEA